MTTLKIGGPLAIRCSVCTAEPRQACRWNRRGAPFRKPHAPRVKAAPPEMEVKAGDFVIVRWGSAELVAVLTQVDWLRVRLWREHEQRLTAPEAFPREHVLRLAPEDERTAAARAAFNRWNDSPEWDR